MKLDIVKIRFWCLAFTALLILPGIIGMAYLTIKTPTHTPLKVGIVPEVQLSNTESKRM